MLPPQTGITRTSQTPGFLSPLPAHTTGNTPYPQHQSHRHHHHHHHHQQTKLFQRRYDENGEDLGPPDLADRSLNLLDQIMDLSRRQVSLSTAILPPRPQSPQEAQSGTTTLAGGYLFLSGLSLVLGNILYPATFFGFLYLSRPVEAPDYAAAIAAALTTGVVSSLLSSVTDYGDGGGAGSSAPFIIGLGVLGVTLVQVLGAEQREAFIRPQERIEETRPFRDEERDLRFFDTKMKMKSTSSQEKKSTRDDSGGGASKKRD